MIHYVLSSRVASDTGRRLAAAIEVAQGRRCAYVCGTPRFPDRRHVRYGSHVDAGHNCLNYIENVVIAANKLEALQKMSSAGVSVPKTYAEARSAPGLPLIFRKTSRRAGNDNPYIVRQGECLDWNVAGRYDYAMQFIEKSDEWRVHIFHGRAIRAQRKEPQIGTTPNGDIRSLSRGWMLRQTADYPPGLAVIGKAAVAALGLDFGAVDVVSDRNGKWFVLEVNTAPGLTDKGVARYVKQITQWDQQNEE